MRATLRETSALPGGLSTDSHASAFGRVLLTLIDEVLAARRGVASFCRAYVDHWVEHVPDLKLSQGQLELLLSVQQKIDWADANPSAVARYHGWIDYDQLFAWLIERVTRYEIDASARGVS